MRKLIPLLAILFAMLTAACSSASTATPLPDKILPTPTSAPVALATATPVPPPPAPTRTRDEVDSLFIQLTDPLDEPQFYCLDVPGAGTAVRLYSALQAHTCKPLETAEDELFSLDHPGDGQIYMDAYDLCVEATGTSPGSTVILAACSESPNQRFNVEADLIRLAGAGGLDLCLAVDPSPGIPTGGPSHLRRDLTLESCDTVGPELSRWTFGIFDY